MHRPLLFFRLLLEFQEVAICPSINGLAFVRLMRRWMMRHWNSCMNNRREPKAAAAKEAERRRLEAEQILQATLARIAENPDRSIARIDAAIAERNRPAYQRAAEELSLLAKACGNPMATAKAESIRAKYPTRRALSNELKKAGF
ncbi:hypothetical protein NZK35_25625 [Stieleria sp. ICT_E10.1]|uniref:hypothetical protein n=1 Tax=Stieleria sedimenti TaxID=2976331 RepID=UPI002180851D|nr:hypothetical protein [Stieleria sedimenti]MCS7470039.1 hypothetical protein [Stieleria sedimenti]